ncbi:MULTISPECIES: class I SAM-dependent methyltransferase [Cytobacillus]|jgi:trans-aconitate methyltransferase|uniref:class I SAM-dependent methyltransferase n=1 Tax=Cytobacillus TaxID=2675230 RepID=UPI00203CC4B6|nr:MULTISPECIES: class I SAM-dependent methyltransferase [Cytobacillus]MBY0155200.1 class I SAM-dependent methyltransferase [Cytobacillus firmus]MCM3393498.1 class I SAM-dependent methyltransferase [Cytobacillus oceanisediminis]MCM3530596.1 class I SAM-dependent methyltransferase [Cytobacillus oceanisediminis]MCS0827542.1 class I SAM-dependent methyltransferase [Cytobacillus firmus]UQX54782.1 class I SAM-dependent methyltransferase [Cytobacillus pseudoceanisediminis]
MFDILAKQFQKPAGLLGKLAGKIMYFENRKINKWTIQQLKINRRDSILEVGFGPGYSIRHIMDHFRHAETDGVDVSEDMKASAAKRNDEYIRQGKVRLFVKDIHDYFPDKTYNKIFSVNNYPLWTKPRESLQYLYGMLEEDGIIAITVQPREEGADDTIAKNLGQVIKTDMEAAGFHSISISYKEARPVLTVCVTAIK